MENNECQPHSDCPRKHKGQKITLYLMLAILLLFLIGTIVVFPMVFEGSEKEAVIRIPKGADASMVEDSVAKYLGETYAERVMRYTKLRHIDFAKRHGQYVIPKGTSALNAMKILFRRGQTPVRITVNGNRSLDNLTDRIASKFEFTPGDLRELLNDSAFLAGYSLRRGQALALFLNDTYEYYWTDTPGEVMKKIGDNYLKFWNDDRREKARLLGLSPADVMILSSIVDEESNKADEKGKIGRLYINRLHKNMRLQSDPTVRFALNDFTIKRVFKSHLEVNSPYNTYRNAGLPPGPIRTIEAATVDSILSSKPNNYIYMCAREDLSGYHNFSENYSDHLKNALRYQYVLNSKGIK